MNKTATFFICAMFLLGITINAQTPAAAPAGTVSNATPASGTAHGNPGGKTMSYSNTAWPAFTSPCYTYGFRDTLYAAILGDLGAPPSNGPCTGSSNLVYDAGLSNLAGGIIVYTGSTDYKYILGSAYAYTTQALPVRVTIRFTDGAAAAIPVLSVGSAKLIKVTQDFNVNLLYETYSPADAQYFAPGTPNTWTPSISLFDYLWTDPNRSICTSFSWGSFYTFSVVPTASSTSPYCEGNTINLSSSATTEYGGPLSYSWTGPLTYSNGTQNPSITGATTGMSGNYIVSVTDALGCVGSSTTTVVVNTLPSAASSNTAVCAGQSGTLTASGGGTYSWSTGATTAAITESPSSTTTYTVTVTNGAGCTAQATGTITVNPNPTASSSASSILCNGGTSTVTVSASGGTSPYSGTGTFVVSAGGPYSYVVTDNNGCASTTTISVTEPTVLAPSSSATAILCNGGTATVTVGATGGTAPYSGTGAFTVTAGGPYSYIVTDNNGCTATTTISVTEPTALIPSSSSSAILCYGGTSTVTVGASGGTAPYSGTGTFTVSAGGPYSYVVTDNNGCTSTTTITVTEPTALVSTSSSSPILCNGGTSTVTVGASGGTAPYSGTGSFTVVVGTYTYTVTDANGCTNTTTITVTQPGAVSVTATASSSTICSGDSITLTALNGAPAPTYCQPVYATGTQFGDYVSSVVCNTLNSASGASPTPYYTLFPASSPTTTTLVAGSTYTITLVCGTYTINDIAAFIDFNQNGALDNAGEKLGETDNMGAAPASTSFVFTVPPTALNGTTRLRVREMDHGGSNDIDPCLAQSIYGETEDYIITITGGVDPLTFTWGPATFLNTTTGATVNADGMTASTTYTVTATDGNGCTSTATTAITVNALPVVTASAASGTICNGSSETLTAGGASTYVWSSGGTNSTEVVSPTTTSTYTVTGTDGNGCANTATVSVTVNALPTVTAVATAGAICTGSTDTLSAGGASTYAWSSGGTNSTEVVSPIASSTYTVTGTDANGCVNTATVSVTVNALPVVTASALSGTICNGSTDTLSAGGASTYVWSSGGTSSTEAVNPTTSSTYTVTGTDANGCVDTATVTVNVNALPTVTYSEPIDTACGGSLPNPPFTLTGENPAGGSWSGPGVSGNMFDASTANIGMNIIIYSYTDGNGCSASATDSIYVDLCMDVTPQSEVSTTFTLYPNPTSGMLNIITNGEYATIVVTDALGQQVTSIVTNSTTTQLDLSQNANGMYFVRVEQNGNYSTQRVMIAK